MTVARVNGAFANTNEMKKIADAVRSVSSEVALMIDIKGHEVRLNKFDHDLQINVGDQVIIGSDSSEYIYPETYPNLYENINPGNRIIIDDGNTVLYVEKVENKKIYTKVLAGNSIPKGKGINIPGVFLNNSAVTERDKEQIKFAVENKWDFVAASFVRCKEDVEEVKHLLTGSHTKVISKIEDAFGVENIHEIIQASEGIMVARGDLAVEIPYYTVPHIQKAIIKKCNNHVKPVIVATQMLESMIHNAHPTRAEISDVANAICDGADAVMLSAETTTGEYPVECVQTMKEIAIETEKYLYNASEQPGDCTQLIYEMRDQGTELAIAVAQSVANLSYKIPDAKIIVDTRTGFSAKLVASCNVKNSVIAMTPYDYYARRLSLCKGIIAVQRNDLGNYQNMSHLEQELINEALQKNLISKGDRIILVVAASYNFISSPATNEKAAVKVLSI